MAGPNTRLLDLDAFVPRSIEIQFAGVMHRVPGHLLTAGLVVGLQELGEKVQEGEDATAIADLIDLVESVTLHAEPPLSVKDMPPTVLAPLAVFLVEGSGGAPAPDEDPPPKRRRAAGSTTPRSTPRTARKR